jgi:hypothetical protein
VNPAVGRRIRLMKRAGRDLESSWKPKEGATGKILAILKPSLNDIPPSLGPFVSWDDKTFCSWLDSASTWEFID